jgi:2-oxo-4-hydroxy-4-carboxy-5-ureidoimidazoline decarboxylase
MISREEFVERFGGVVEHSSWVAERAYAGWATTGRLDAGSVHVALVSALRAGSDAERLAVLRAHPDLAGGLAIAGELTASSQSEQAGAGLDRLSGEEHARFTHLNDRYQTRFGFPFIIAVKGLDKGDILAAFERRIDNPPETELATACAEVEKIAGLRLASMLPETAP